MKYTYVLLLCISFIYSEEVFRSITLEQAYVAAQENNQNIILYFDQQNHKPCRLMRRLTLQDHSITWWLRKSITIRLDAEKNSDLLDQFSIKIFPTIVMIDKSKKVVQRVEGYVSPQELQQVFTEKLPSVHVAVMGHPPAQLAKPWRTKIIIENGNVPLNNVVLKMDIPEHLIITDIKQSLPWQKSETFYIAKIKNLFANDKLEISLSGIVKTLGKHCLQFHFSSDEYQKKFSHCAIARGFPSMSLDIIDTEDPIIVGEYTTYCLDLSN